MDTRPSTPDVVAGGISKTDRHIGSLQERLRLVPSDQKSATALGLAYLQRARETSDPSFLSRAGGILRQALDLAPDDTDTLVGMGTLALARHQFQEALEWGHRSMASNAHHTSGYGVVADALTELGRYDEAVGVLQQAVGCSVSACSLPLPIGNTAMTMTMTMTTTRMLRRKRSAGAACWRWACRAACCRAPKR